jgi:hypothetical protein
MCRAPNNLWNLETAIKLQFTAIWVHASCWHIAITADDVNYIAKPGPHFITNIYHKHCAARFRVYLPAELTLQENYWIGEDQHKNTRIEYNKSARAWWESSYPLQPEIEFQNHLFQPLRDFSL